MALARAHFRAINIVLVEGGKSDARLRKIEVLRRSLSGGIQTSPGELDAVVADYAAVADLPLFRPGEVKRIADWLVAFYDLKARGGRISGGT